MRREGEPDARERGAPRVEHAPANGARSGSGGRRRRWRGTRRLGRDGDALLERRLGSPRAERRRLCARERSLRARARRGRSLPGHRGIAVRGPQHEARDERGRDDDGGEDELHGTGSEDQRGSRQRLAQQGQEDLQPCRAALAARQPLAQARQRAREPAVHRGARGLHAPRDLALGQLLEEAQEHGGAIGLVELEHGAHELALQGRLLDDVVRRGPGLERGRHLLAPPAARARALEVDPAAPQHAREPAAHGPAEIGGPLERGHPRVLREVLGEMGVQRQAPGEGPGPPGLREQGRQVRSRRHDFARGHGAVARFDAGNRAKRSCDGARDRDGPRPVSSIPSSTHSPKRRRSRRSTARSGATRRCPHGGGWL